MKRKRMGALLLTLCMMFTMLPAIDLHAESASDTPSTINGEITVQLPLNLDGRTPKDSEIKRIRFYDPNVQDPNLGGISLYEGISSYDLKFYDTAGNEMSDTDTFNDVDTYKATFSLKTDDPSKYIFGENNTVAVEDYWGWYRNYSATTETFTDANGNTGIRASFEFNLTRRIVDCDIPFFAPTYTELIGTHPDEWTSSLVHASNTFPIPEGEIAILDLLNYPEPTFYTANGKEMAADDTFVEGESYTMKFPCHTLNGNYYVLSGDNNVILVDYPNQANPVKAKTTVSKDEYNNTVLNVEYIYQPEETEPSLNKVYTEDLTEVTGNLANTEFNTVEKIENKLTETIVSNAGYTAENTALYDIELVTSEDGGQTWIPVTAANFPKEGIEVTLSYPEGTNGSEYHFTAVHMFDEDVNGHKAGELEIPKVTAGKDGISFRLMGTSPVMIGYKKAAAAHTHSYGKWTDCKDGKNHQRTCSCGDVQKEAHIWDDGKVTKEATKDAEGFKTYTCKTCGATKTESIPKSTSNSTTNTTSPKTGDSTNLALWIIVMVAAGLSCIYFVRRKTKSNN